ncbi:MAG: hypothetical protein RIS47_984 [Bacteroidota bacterium]|jgi:hypothetical protein
MKLYQIVIVAIIGFVLLRSCTCSSNNMAEYEKSPVDDIIRDLNNVKPFEIVLYDMDADDGMTSNTFRHKYKVITNDPSGTPSEKITDWKEVSESFFAANQDNMGMTIASKDSTGKLSKTPSPAGYANYVGNPKYGQWTQQNGSSFWEFYGKYAMLQSVLGMVSGPSIFRNNYSDYRSSWGNGRAYYGPSSGGRSWYGTRGSATSNTYKNSTWSSKPASFRDDVRSRVSRSSSSRSRVGSSGTWGSSSSRSSSRSGSRFSSSSSSRSRGGGSGK